MNKSTPLPICISAAFCFVFAGLLLSGCQSGKSCCSDAKSSASPSASSSLQTAAQEPAAVVVVKPIPAHTNSPTDDGVIRIKAGLSNPMTDAEGHVWLADQGFTGGDVIERPDTAIANTKLPMLYQSEHYGMESFSRALPNGKYLVRLHFAETYDGITGPDQRIFSFTVQGKEFNDFDIWKVAGGPQRAYVQNVEAVVTNGKLEIKFTSKVQNTEINGIEIVPGT